MIELWETYLLQLDSEEDGPPLVPIGVRADTADPDSANGQTQEQPADAVVDSDDATVVATQDEA